MFPAVQRPSYDNDDDYHSSPRRPKPTSREFSQHTIHISTRANSTNSTSRESRVQRSSLLPLPLQCDTTTIICTSRRYSHSHHDPLHALLTHESLARSIAFRPPFTATHRYRCRPHCPHALVFTTSASPFAVVILRFQREDFLALLCKSCIVGQWVVI